MRCLAYVQGMGWVRANLVLGSLQTCQISMPDAGTSSKGSLFYGLRNQPLPPKSERNRDTWFGWDIIQATPT